MVWRKKKNKYDKDMKKKRDTPSEGRRGFLKLIGVGSAVVASTAVSKVMPAFPEINGKKVLPITEDNNAFVEIDSPTPEIVDDENLNHLPPVDGQEVQRYLRQEGTNRIYVYDKRLANRKDMKEVEPA